MPAATTSRPATVDLTQSSSDRNRSHDRHHHRHSSSSTSSSSHHRHHSSSRPHPHSSSSHPPRSSSSSSKHPPPPPPPSTSDPSSLVKKTSQFQFEPVFTNTLPTPPAAPKRLLLPSSSFHLTAYCGGSLLSTYRSPLLTDDLLSLPLNFIDPTAYIAPTPPPPPRPLSPTSAAAFLSPSSLTPHPPSSSSSSPSSHPHLPLNQPTRAQLYRQGYSNWARKPEYTANNPHDSRGVGGGVGLVDVRKREVEEVVRRKEEREKLGGGMVRQGQIDRIEATFRAAQHPPLHPRKRGTVHAVQVLPVLPDAAVDGRFGWVEFDYDPATGDGTHLPPPLPSTLLLPLGGPGGGGTGGGGGVGEGGGEGGGGGLGGSGGVGGGHALYIQRGGTGGEKPAGGNWSGVHGRDYELVPTPAVDASNNFFFIVGDEAVGYARYGRRMKLNKRMKRGVREESEIMENRPMEVRVEYVEGGGGMVGGKGVRGNVKKEGVKEEGGGGGQEEGVGGEEEEGEEEAEGEEEGGRGSRGSKRSKADVDEMEEEEEEDEEELTAVP